MWLLDVNVAAALVARKTRAILDYLDFKPVEDLCAAGVLRAAARRKQSESESRNDLREE